MGASLRGAGVEIPALADGVSNGAREPGGGQG